MSEQKMRVEPMTKKELANQTIRLMQHSKKKTQTMGDFMLTAAISYDGVITRCKSFNL